MTVPAKYHSFSWLWQISLKNGEWKKIMDEMPGFSFDKDTKEVAAGIEIGEKIAEVLYYKFHEDGTYEKKKSRRFRELWKMELFTPHRKKNFSLFR